jgi:hypothetical protein
MRRSTPVAKSIRPLRIVVARLYPLELEAIAEVLPVCRLRDELRSPIAEQSQSFFTLRVDIEHFLEIEDVAAVLVWTSCDTEEFLRPQASQPAFQHEQSGMARYWQRDS